MKTFKSHLLEGRPSQQHPLEDHEYHRKSDAELEYIGKDARAAAEAMKGHNTEAENKYSDQASDAATVRHFRKRSGMPNWYKKKYGHMKEETEIQEDCQTEFLEETYKFKRKTDRQWQGTGFGTSSAEHELHHEGQPTGITMDASTFGYTVRHKNKRVKKADTLKDAKEAAINYHKNLKEDWQKVNRQDNTDGLSQKAVNAYRKENPGSKLQTAVTEKKPSGKRAERRKSFCRRMKGMKARLTSAKTARDPDSRINKALRRWNC